MNGKGLCVRDDLAIVGYDSDFAAAPAAALPSVQHPRGQPGRAAARLLMEALERRHESGVWEPEPSVRYSSAATPS